MHGLTTSLLFTRWLGIIYFLTTDSLFIGSLLSVFIWLASALILIEIMRILLITRPRQFLAILAYAVVPSSILYTSVTLREVYELFFVNLSIYAALKIYFHKSIVHWPILQTMIFFGLKKLPPALFLMLSVSFVGLASVLMWHLVESRFLKSSSHYRQGSLKAPA